MDEGGGCETEQIVFELASELSRGVRRTVPRIPRKRGKGNSNLYLSQTHTELNMFRSDGLELLAFNETGDFLREIFILYELAGLPSSA